MGYSSIGRAGFFGGSIPPIPTKKIKINYEKRRTVAGRTLVTEEYKSYCDVNKTERIKRSLVKNGSRNDRKLQKYSVKFNKMFEFYFKIYRSGLVKFCGDIVKVDFDVNGSEGKFAFREYDNGRFKLITPISRHPNILQSVIIGKKGWGLWVSQWTDGIVDWSFTKEEILKEFELRDIEIPESLMIEWDKLILKRKIIRNENYIKSK